MQENEQANALPLETADGRRIPWVGVLLAAAFAFALALPASKNFDIWWHLRTGQYILEEGHVPREDMYSFVAQGTYWVNPSWLADVGMFAVWRAGGFALLRLLTACAFAAAIAVAVFAVPRREDVGWPAIVAALVCCHGIWQCALMRPLIFSLPLTAFFLWVLRGRRDRWLWTLPVLVVLWANLHAGFAAGLMLVFFAFVEELVIQWRVERTDLRRARALLLTGVAGGLACLVNPFGYGVLTYSFRLTGSEVFMAKIEEWMPPTSDPAFWPYWGLLGLVALSVLVTCRRASLFDIACLAAFGWLSVCYRRQIGVFGLVSLPILGKHLAIATLWLGRRTSAGPRPRLAVLGRVLLVCLVAVASAKRWHDREDDVVPTKAAEFLASLDFEGGVFSEYDWGGYLIWRLFPQQQVFMDGRCLVHGDTRYLEWEKIYLCKQGWEEALEEHKVQCLLVKHRRPPLPNGMPNPLPFTSQNWWTVYWDDDGVVLLKNTPANAKAIAQHNWSLTNPATVVRFLGARRGIPQIEAQLLRKLSADPTCAVAHENLGQCLLARKEYAPAAAALEKAVSLRPQRAAAWYNLGFAESKLNRLEEAARHCARATDLDGTQPIYFLKLGDVYEQMGNTGAAARALQRVVELVGAERTPKLQQRIQRLQTGAMSHGSSALPKTMRSGRQSGARACRWRPCRPRSGQQTARPAQLSLGSARCAGQAARAPVEALLGAGVQS